MSRLSRLDRFNRDFDNTMATSPSFALSSTRSSSSGATSQRSLPTFATASSRALSPSRPGTFVPSPLIAPTVLAPRHPEWVTWQRAALAALALSLVALGTAAAALSATYSTYVAQNTPISFSWGLRGCYDRPTGGGTSATVCDSETPFSLVCAALACDAALLLALGALAAQAAAQFATGAPATTAWAAGFFSSAGLVLGAARCAFLAAAVGLKDAELASFASWSSKGAGWRCLVVALCIGVAQLVVLALLAMADTYVSERVREADAFAAHKEMVGAAPRPPDRPVGLAQVFADARAAMHMPAFAAHAMHGAAATADHVFHGAGFYSRGLGRR